MRALRSHTRGGAETLVYEEAPEPKVGADDVLIEVHAAAITFHEFMWPETWAAEDGSDRTPIIPSHEVSGVVRAVGPSVTRFAIGDEVFGRIAFYRDGAAAEYTVAAEADLAHRPLALTHVESAAIPLAALTAWQALVDHATVEQGDSVTILGAGGGVGVYAVQVAKLLGASVSATAGSADVDFVTGLGADLVVDYRDGESVKKLPLADILIDTVGGNVLEGAVDLVRPGGRLITLSAPPAAELGAEREIDVTFFIVREDPEQLEKIAALFNEGKLRSIVADVYPLERGRSAYEDGPSSKNPGKVVIKVKD
ncbi:MAG TPA: NADP-dependent oxidoreductase [Glaciibacter sp.]|nr:NADP-dependent oxidoreductase [Glaciibacter sp.]